MKKQKGFWPVVAIIICFILGSISASKLQDGKPRIVIDSTTIKVDSLTIIKIYVYGR